MIPENDSRQPLLSWDHITLAIDDVTILNDFSCQVKRGETLLFFGPSGTGKSTLLKTFLGFFPVEKGTIHFNGEPVGLKDFWGIRQQISYVPQDTDLGEGPVEGLVSDVLAYKNNRNGSAAGRFETLLKEFELSPDTVKKNFENLSGGEKQRVCLALALTLDRSILFLDEITASLDPELTRRVIDSIVMLQDKTIVVVSHDEEWLNRKEIRPVRFPEAEK